ncbi:tellurite resistance TerB C-terminal domain-containing protein, partial [Salinibacter altiplanensis]|uniref:tellurite resistance TerB family protein n=1 Tax=Salinibacter altiplanensis TaxID=1803181 RepID=UPI0018E4A094
LAVPSRSTGPKIRAHILIRERAGDKANQFVQQIEDWMGDKDRAVIASETLLEHWPSKNEDYLTKTEAEALSGFLAGFGFGVEPDIRYTRNPSKRDHLTIFRMEGDGEEPGETFESARLLVHLAAAVAGADDEIAPGEEVQIERHLEEALDLSEGEQARLRAHLARLLKHPPSMRGVRRRAEELSDEQRRSLATFLLTVAGADGYLDGEEISILEKIYDILELDADQVHQDLHSLSAREPGDMDDGPVTVIEGEEQETYRVPDEEEPTSSEEDPSQNDAGGVNLDLERVSEVQDETQDVARVLDDVFSDGEDEAPAFSVDGLTEAHESLLMDLQEKEKWERTKFEELAEDHGLIPGFAIEQINDSAFEVADEPLLEGEDPIELNSYALDALQS